MAAQMSFGQYTTTWPANALNGKAGIGTKPTAASTAIPNFDLQIHGTTDYSEDNAASGLAQDNSNPKPVSGTEKILTNFGKTSRIGLTNTITGLANTDGTVLRMSENNFTLANKEAGDIVISVPNVSMSFNNASKRIFIGGLSSPTSTDYAKFNIAPGALDNGIYVHNLGTGTYGLAIRTAINTNDAIRVQGVDLVKNFSVKGTGEVNTKDLFVNGVFRVTNGSTTNEFSVDNTGKVRAREILVDENTIPDYVFKEDYKLMTLKDLEQFVSKNHHLPNVKSEIEFQQAGGVDLGEMNLKLLEKVEELTLYVIDLQKQIIELKNK